MKKIRLDQLLVDRGLAESREKAKRLVLAGQVLIDGQPAPKPGHPVTTDHEIEIKQSERFVSRGGEKLEEAVQAFDLDLTGKVCLDIGSSTGGFTDCMLQHEAVKVYAVDVGKGQLHWKLREDDRVVVMEGVNARYLTAQDIPEAADFASIDTSFISLTKILPAVKELLKPGGQIVSLIKPQFEAGKEEVDKGRGVITDPAIHKAVISKVRNFGTAELGLEWLGLATSPIKGPKGNIEFLAYWQN
ncbi:TlyA family RNA methyltransferase [Tichowtungia aerotolerans]|uniref:TlyA family rRNA (Cytidine-2'-O)-methyltransferase n=1 Tax=Tichowtungia aerotolerans TaxID=2697043 RepID=A0A6P1ME48_9BACT|nr:TlyA family RNA methyltransferase [Tichowtungia aerotolerans]QHI69876.1 TlyA family rRNA (cytidine-2'-O)-methyltransferase [Tichowtungia aerotolerans]